MNLNKKKFLALMGIILVIAAGTWIFFKDRNNTGYIFDKDDRVGMVDVHTLRRQVDFEGTNVKEAGIHSSVGSAYSEKENEAELDLSGGRGPMVLKYFRFLQSKFSSSSNIATHCSDIWKYLISVMPKGEAERIFAAYRKYLDCEIELSNKLKDIRQPKNIDEVIAVLSKVQDFRRSMLGEEMADGLFGAEVKTREYALRRGSIVADKNMYGKEKENRIENLTSDMWSEDQDQVQSVQPSYNRYREKMEIYSRDLIEMASDDDRQAAIAEFRKEFFTPDVVARLEETDRQIKSEKTAESQYRQKESEVMASASMGDDEKKEVIEGLQSRYFGDDAEAFRRREAIRKGGEEIMARYTR